jgi:hypothetical protein
MSLLNKFIAPELKIKSKNKKTGTKSKVHSKHSLSPASAAKSGLNLSANFNTIKAPAGLSGGGGGGLPGGGGGR